MKSDLFTQETLPTRDGSQITWILTGLWHGTGAGYLAWGLYYGILITFSVTFLDDFRTMIHKIGIDTECFSYRLFRAVKIFFVFMGEFFVVGYVRKQFS